MAGEAIYICYRRDDTADVAGRIYDAMAQRFGKARVFKDVDNISPGVDFGDYIKTVLPRCRVALVLIGPQWLDSKDESGKRRLDDDHDWVRLEIETALATPDVLVVPVLVNGARTPRGEEIPESVRPLLRRNAAIVRRDPDFHDDVERLAAALRASLSTGILDLSKIGGKANGPRSQRRGGATLLVGGATAAVLVALVWTSWRNTAPPTGSAPTASAAGREAQIQSLGQRAAALGIEGDWGFRGFGIPPDYCLITVHLSVRGDILMWRSSAPNSPTNSFPITSVGADSLIVDDGQGLTSWRRISRDSFDHTPRDGSNVLPVETWRRC